MVTTRVRVHVQDQYGNPIEGAVVWSSEIAYPDSVPMPRTDSSGNVTEHMPVGEKWDFNTLSPDPLKYECVVCKTIIMDDETPVITFVMNDLTRVEMPAGADPLTWGPTDDMSIEQADAAVKAGTQVYIKCVLPLLDLLPGLPYYIGIPILPGFRLTTKP